MKDTTSSIMWHNFFMRLLTFAFVNYLLTVGQPDLIDAVIHWLMHQAQP
jgi:hypothetical protein